MRHAQDPAGGPEISPNAVTPAAPISLLPIVQEHVATQGKSYRGNMRKDCLEQRQEWRPWLRQLSSSI